MKAITVQDFGKTKNGTACRLYTIENERGDRASFTEFGAALVSWQMKEDDGSMRDLVLGYDAVSHYEKNGGNLGAVCGRFANRIRFGEFRLNDKMYKVPKGDNLHVCHSGDGGFHSRVWTYEAGEEGTVTFTYLAKDGETGFPGNLNIKVTYAFDDDRQLLITYEAESDKDTIINVTNHSYFNLDGAEDVSSQLVEVNASFITPVDEALIPTGEVRSVEGTDFDLREAVKLGDVFASKDEALARVGGLDHNFVVDGEERGELRYAARLINPKTKTQLVCYTTEPAVQVYTANCLDAYEGSGGRVFGVHKGICFETQNFPASPNYPHFPSPVLRAGDKYISRTIYAYVTCGDLE